MKSMAKFTAMLRDAEKETAVEQRDDENNSLHTVGSTCAYDATALGGKIHRNERSDDHHGDSQQDCDDYAHSPTGRPRHGPPARMHIMVR